MRLRFAVFLLLSVVPLAAASAATDEVQAPLAARPCEAQLAKEATPEPPQVLEEEGGPIPVVECGPGQFQLSFCVCAFGRAFCGTPSCASNSGCEAECREGSLHRCYDDTSCGFNDSCCRCLGF